MRCRASERHLVAQLGIHIVHLPLCDLPEGVDLVTLQLEVIPVGVRRWGEIVAGQKRSDGCGSGQHAALPSLLLLDKLFVQQLEEECEVLD